MLLLPSRFVMPQVRDAKRPELGERSFNLAPIRETRNAKAYEGLRDARTI
jgi:hypothetical protein